MQHYIDSVTAFNGDKITDAVISVTTLAGNGVTIYLDEAGLQPVSFVNSDNNGEFNFYVPSGRYNINVSGSGITSYTLSDVFIFYPNNDVIPVVSGGTGVTTSTGTGSVVLNTSPTLITPILGTPTSGNLSNCTVPVGSITGTLPVLNGGTGVTTSTGTGNTVLSASPTFTGTIIADDLTASTLNLTGNVGIGGATASTSGTGITFPATQSASSDANTLDDYEEGTYTPVLTFAVNTGMTYTASTANGKYTKIGDVVTCRAYIAFSAFSAGTASGAARISLPFPVDSLTGNYSAATYGAAFTTLFPTLALAANIQAYVQLYGNTAVNVVPTILTPANFAATSQVLFSMSYKV